MSRFQVTSPSPVVLLDSVSVNLSPAAIAELIGMGEDAGMGQDAAEDLVLEPINTDDAVIIGDDDWFQSRAAASNATPRLPSGGKNIKAMEILKSLRSPSPTPSTTSASQSAAGEDSDEDWSKFLEEEQQRRAEEEARRVEWCRRAAGRRGVMEVKLNKARELVSSLKGEEKSLRNQREALRAQLRALDDQEHCLDKRKRSALQKMKKYESIVAKYKAMNI